MTWDNTRKWDMRVDATRSWNPLPMLICVSWEWGLTLNIACLPSKVKGVWITTKAIKS